MLKICLAGLVFLAIIVGGNSLRAEIVEGEGWTVQPDFHGKKARFELSGAICAGGQRSRTWCLGVNDEKKYAQFFSIAGATLSPARRIRLLPKSESDSLSGEIDAEAVAYYDGFIYVAASHGLSRKSAKFRPSQFFVYRFPVNRETGTPLFEFNGDSVPLQVERSGRLRMIIQRNSVLGPFAEQSLSINGANIEGLVVDSDGMHFGFRAPTLDGKAMVLSVKTDVLFGQGVPDASISRLRLGYGMGIRDLAATSKGILVLAGPAGDDDLASHVYHWDRATGQLNNFGALPTAVNGKAEALLLLSEISGDGAKAFKILILYDGRKNGGPREFLLKAN